MPVTLCLPPLAAFVISFVTSMAGISGAVLLAPLQISFLGVAGPAVSATSLLFNVIATPGAVYRYFRRAGWYFRLPCCSSLGLYLARCSVSGSVWIRVRWLSDSKRFKIFCALLLPIRGQRPHAVCHSGHIHRRRGILRSVKRRPRPAACPADGCGRRSGYVLRRQVPALRPSSPATTPIGDIADCRVHVLLRIGGIALGSGLTRGPCVRDSSIGRHRRDCRPATSRHCAQTLAGFAGTEGSPADSARWRHRRN
jgi:hypothetical protein